MADEQQTDPEQHEGGRVVYSRLHAEGAADAPVQRAPVVQHAGAFVLPGGREVEPFLPVLIVSFLLLVGVVVWLGWSSEGKVQQVSKAIQDREQGQAFKTKTLLQLHNALTDLNDRARHREEQLQRHDEQG